METINFLKLARERYSCRQLSDRKVEAEKLNRILEAARIAPTAHNEQPFRLFLLESPEAVEKAKEITPSRLELLVFLWLEQLRKKPG